jgi:asparagine synthase (glutamine-hydrolysing)
MCGICGFIDRENPDLLDQMTTILTHRGPDDGGTHVAPLSGRQGISLHLGNRRLSIIDLSPAGHQPMANEDRSVWLTFKAILCHPGVPRSLDPVALDQYLTSVAGVRCT